MPLGAILICARVSVLLSGVNSSVLKGWGFRVVTKCERGWRCMGRAGSHPALEGNGLTLNVDMAGSLLYLSMVWNLDEWLSSWYSSECLLRVCITFWKGRKEGTAKMNQRETKKKKRQKGRGASIWAGRGTGMGKRLRDCSDTSHERGVREGRRQIDRLLAHAHTSSTSFSLSEFGN